MNFLEFSVRTPLLRGIACMSLATTLCAALPITAHGAEEEVGIVPVQVGAGPYYFDTAEQHDIRVDILARGLAHAYSLAFLPNGDALITERGARLRLVRHITSAKPSLVDTPVAGSPDFSNIKDISPMDVFGIQDIAIHPDFAKNQFVYYTFNRPVKFDSATKRWQSTTVLARAKLRGQKLVDAQDLLVGEAVQDTGGSRILFGKDDMVYVSVGSVSAGDVSSAQRTDNIYGKVLRIKDDGSIPTDNPFVNVKGARGEIYSYGHRDPLGLTLDVKSGDVIASEHGPQGGDKINRILAGRNYGWPIYTYGTEYGGSPMPTTPVGPNTEPPLMIWSPAIAPSGTTFYEADKVPAWKHNLFVASCRHGETNGSGALVRVVFNDKLQEKRQESLLQELHQRIRDVRQGPDGLLYVLTDEDNSVLMRISPVPHKAH